MNEFIKLNRVEFLLTKRCNAGCRHCSVPINSDPAENGYKDIGIVKQCFNYLIENYNIASIMVYGGEPILYADKAIQLFEIATCHEISSIDLITSGFISTRETRETISAVADELCSSGVKRILLSVDAFHQERIPIEYVEWFLESAVKQSKCVILLHPAWLVSKEDENAFNLRTREILNLLSCKYNVGISGGNYIIPSGSNKRYIGKYYQINEIHLNKKCGEIPYTNPLNRITSIRILPDGSVNICRGVTIGNIFEKSIEEIIETYSPKNNVITAELFSSGVKGIYNLAKERGLDIDPEDYYGTCDFCADCIRFLKERGVG